MKKILIPAGVVVIVLIIVNLFSSNNSAINNTSSNKTLTENYIENDQAGSYIEYSEANLIEATKNGKAIIFFHASWCSTCRAADKSISGDLSSIPENLTILKTDYDSQTALKKKYGVTGQHTFVQVNAQGEMMTKWSGGDLKIIIARVK